jgi:hypothetical protein
LRREPIEKRKALLAKLLKGSHLSIVLNEHFNDDGTLVFCEACRLGCEGPRVEAAWLAIPLRPAAALIEGQEPDGARRNARGRGISGPLK